MFTEAGVNYSSAYPSAWINDKINDKIPIRGRKWVGESISLFVFNDRGEVGRLKKYWGEIKFTTLSYGGMNVSRGLLNKRWPVRLK